MRSIVLVLSFLAFPVFSQTGWFPLNTLISNTMIGVHFINADTGFVWTQWDGNWRTSNGGLTWEPLNADGREMLFVDNNRIGYFYQRLGVYETTDHGLTWKFRDDIGDQDIEFPTPRIGYSIVEGLGDERDSNGVIFGESLDSGKTWIYKHLDFGGQFRYEGERIFFRDTMYGFLIVRHYNYQSDPKNFQWKRYYTTDGGKTWDFAFEGPVEIFDVLHLYEKTWLYSGLSGAILRTDDDFITADQVSLNTVPSKVTYCFPEGKLSKASDAHIYSFDHKGVYHSPDTGTTWYRQFCEGYTGGQWGYDISMGSEKVGYFVGLDSQVYKTIDGGGPPLSALDLKSCNCEVKATPNPAKDYLMITIGDADEATLKVFDALGRSISTEMVGKGQLLRVKLTNGWKFDMIGRIGIIRHHTVTHAFAYDQRYIELEKVRLTDSGIDSEEEFFVKIPTNPNLAPPGPYMLFVMSKLADGASGAPSIAQIVMIT